MNPDRSWTWAVRVLFLANGMTFSTWLARMPEIRDRLGVSLSGLGLSLLGGGLGGVVGALVAPRILRRLGSRAGGAATATVMSIGIVGVAVAPGPVAFGALLVVLGGCDVTADIAMNSQGLAVQAGTHRSVMHAFHAAWSLGSVVGAGIGSAAGAADVPLAVHLVVVACCLLAAQAWAWPRLAGVDPAAPGSTAPPAPVRGSTLVPLLVLVAVATAWIEGMPADWSPIFLADVHGAPDGRAGLGFAAFMGGMLVGRIAGDRVTERLGDRRLLAGAMGVAGAGFVVVVAAPTEAPAIAGYLVTGLGVSVLFPVLYRIAGTLDAVDEARGLAVMSIGSRAAWLAAPVLVGGLADATSLRLALGTLVGTALVAAALTATRLAPHARLRLPVG